MTPAENTALARFPLPRWWWSYFVAITAIAVIGLILGVVGIYENNRQNALDAAENKARDEQNKVLLDCFDDFASQLAGGLPPVREATAETNAALAAALLELQGGLVKVGTDSFAPADLESLIAAFGRYQKANANLTQVRKDNPYPDPPSTFCSTR